MRKFFRLGSLTIKLLSSLEKEKEMATMDFELFVYYRRTITIRGRDRSDRQGQLQGL